MDLGKVGEKQYRQKRKANNNCRFRKADNLNRVASRTLACTSGEAWQGCPVIIHIGSLAQHSQMRTLSCKNAYYALSLLRRCLMSSCTPCRQLPGDNDTACAAQGCIQTNNIQPVHRRVIADMADWHGLCRRRTLTTLLRMAAPQLMSTSAAICCLTY